LGGDEDETYLSRTELLSRWIVLSWNQRVNIILGFAAALTYPHEECERVNIEM
jgi:hypothetical protein